MISPRSASCLFDGCNMSDNDTGFTLVEIIAVLVILSILAALAVPRYIDLQEQASMRAIDAGISELNARESLVWGQVKLETGGWSADSDVTGHTDYSTDLGADYTVTSDTITFRTQSASVTRQASTADTPAVWTMD